MAGAYDDRDGFIWMDGAFVPWREAKVHVLTHALHYASSVFEGERCYNGKIFKSHEHSERLLKSCDLLDMPHPYSADEIEAAKAATLAKQRAHRRLCPADRSGAARARTWASPRARNPVHMAIAVWEWGAYYGDAKMKGAKLDVAKWKRPEPGDDPLRGQGRRALHDLHDVQARGRGQGLLGRDHDGLPRLRRRGDRRQRLLRQGRRGAHARARLLPRTASPGRR